MGIVRGWPYVGCPHFYWGVIILFVADGHSDWLSASLRRVKPVSSPDSLKEAGYALQVYAVYVSGGDDACRSLMRQVDRWLHGSEDFKRVLSAGDLPDEPEKDLLYGLLAVEGLLPIGDFPELVRVLWKLGVRVASLVWSRVNAFADGAMFDMDSYRGLSPLGVKVLKYMDNLGMVLDISHLNHRGMDEAMAIFHGAVVATHSALTTRVDIQRNLPPSVAKEIASRGGVVGIPFVCRFLTGEPDCTVNDVVAHIEEAVSLLGEDAVGLGADYDGASDLPIGLERPAGVLQNLAPALEKHLGSDVAHKVLWKNWWDFFKRVLPR